MRVLRENDRWYITLADTRSRCGPFSDVESATVALEELRRLKRLLETKIDYRLIRPLGAAISARCGWPRRRVRWTSR